MHEDTVLCASDPARVVSVVERGHNQWIGQVKTYDSKSLFMPDIQKFPSMEIVGPAPAQGTKVQVGLVSWDAEQPIPTCVVQEVLGQHREPSAELKGVCLQHQIPASFSDEELQAASKATPDEGKNREEVKDLTITIDPSGSRDYDDALSHRTTPDGVIIGVHIADVSAWLPKDSILDKAAYRRGNSTYCVGKVFPMLPETLSNEKCSLKEGARRLTLSVFFTFNHRNECVATRFARAAIRSVKRFNYEQVMAMLQATDVTRVNWPDRSTSNPGRNFVKLPMPEQRRLFTMVRDLGQIAQSLRKERMEQGSLELDSPQFRFTTDSAGYADRIHVETSDPSHQLIEEYMLLANKAVARLMREKDIPIPNRVHEPPQPDRIDEFQHMLACFGETAPDFSDRKAVIQKLIQWRSHPYGPFLRQQLLYCSSKAKYLPSLAGHYGLGFKDYAHFTSPIRRYSDVMAHRALIAHLDGGSRETLQAVQEQCEHISQCEVRSALAERDYARIKGIEYAERVLLKHHTALEAVITDITPRGVEFDVLVAPLRGFFSGGYLRGGLVPGVMPRWENKESGIFWQLGDNIRVKVFKVQFESRKVEFTLLPLAKTCKPQSQ
jgi:ribonuclease R